jgi:hypothetical protein
MQEPEGPHNRSRTGAVLRPLEEILQPWRNAHAGVISPAAVSICQRCLLGEYLLGAHCVDANVAIHELGDVDIHGNAGEHIGVIAA